MPSFDTVSEIDLHEASNAVDQAQREISNRFDFKGVDATLSLTGEQITLQAESEFQLQQMLDILLGKLTSRKIDIRCLDVSDPAKSGKQVTQQATLRQGIDQETAKQLVKLVKQGKLKVQAAIQGDKVRVTGKKRDDLQQAMAHFREAKLELPLQFNNFRD
ncbi:MAG: YajQ family cyclic di-GMP-binding protein [Gammaproteobacteria bacterium]|nr:YajQ family cyclic di-GMP-binding protein [Gammaproteobacteria bacterium]